MEEEFTKHINMGISEDIKKFVDDEVFGDKEYLVIGKIDGENYGHCTKCHNEYWLGQSYKHNEYGICSVCGAKLKVKLSRYGRKNCRNDACFYFFEKSIIDPGVIVCKGYYVSRDYSLSYKKPNTEYALEAVYIFGDKTSKMSKLYCSNFWGDRWEEKKSIFDFNQGWLSPKMCYISRESLKKATKGTRFQYIPNALLQGYNSTVKVFDAFAKYPWLEQIYKMGFSNIVEAKIQGEYLYKCLNYRGKDVFKILKLSRKDAKDIVQSKERITPLFLSLYQLQIKDKSGLLPAEVVDTVNLYGYEFAKLKNILKYTTLKKAVNYMAKQYKKYKKDFYIESGVLTTWSDYIDDCLNLEMNLQNEHTLFPKNVYAAHQNTIMQVKITANERLNKKIVQRLQALQQYCFQSGDLLIRPAYSSNELIAEGKALHHCVGTYAERYAEGKTNILLIRKIYEPEEPYFTLELRQDEIVQVHGKNNCSPDKRVSKFIEEFTEEKLNKKKTKNEIRIALPA